MSTGDTGGVHRLSHFRTARMRGQTRVGGKERMKKFVKKRQLMLVALVAALGLAVYLNFYLDQQMLYGCYLLPAS